MLPAPSQQNTPLTTLGDPQPDIPKNVNPHGAMYPQPGPPTRAQVAHTQAYPPAIDAQGNADCQIGQEGFPTGPLNPTPSRATFDPTYRARSVSNPESFEERQDFDEHYAGGSHTVNSMNTPGLSGPGFFGVPNLHDVP